MNAAMPGRRTSPLARRLRALGERAALVFVRYSAHFAAEPEPGPTCYVLERGQLFDRLVLRDLCQKRGWQRADAVLPDGASAIWGLRAYRGMFGRNLASAGSGRLRNAVTWLQANPDADIRLTPVAVFWGRSPAKESSWIKLLLAEDWAAVGRIRRFFAILVHGRQVLVKVSRPVSLRRLVDEGLGADRTTRKAARLLRVHFRRQRAATIGPDLSHRRLLVDEVLASPAVLQAVRREVQVSHRSVRRVERRARRIAREIAAHYSHSVVRIFERVFAWLWNRLYEGIEIRHFDSLHDIAVGSEVVYVPCHRSHVDYMLLSYVIYRRGLASPHIAAGINLNLPLIGPFLRRGGAFFMRRSFRGDALYTAVFRSYLAAILARGVPIEFFIEGTRSRTGRLLNPKLGLLGMTVESYLRDPRRPVVFVPVFFGYEKLVEGQSFIGELGGKKKSRESLGGALRALRALRERFGAVDVSFGEPIWLADSLDRAYPDWRQRKVEQFFRPPWIDQAVEALGRRIMVAINEAAVANPVGLTALVVLSTPKHAIVEAELRTQLSLYVELLRMAPYSARMGVTRSAPEEIVRHCEEMRWLERRPHRLGDVLYMDARRAVLASYHRNNVIHLFALPGLVAANVYHRADLALDDLRATIRRLYPWFRAELFLRSSTQALDHEVDRVVASMASLGLVLRDGARVRRPAEGTAAAAQFMMCSAIVEPFAEHYYLCMIYLLEHGPDVLDKATVVEFCADAAERLAMLYTLNSPDLFEAGLFDTLLDALLAQGLLADGGDGRLSFGEPLALVADDLGRILRPRVRQTLKLFAGAATTPPNGADVAAGAPLDRSVEPG